MSFIPYRNLLVVAASLLFLHVPPAAALQLADALGAPAAQAVDPVAGSTGALELTMVDEIDRGALAELIALEASALIGTEYGLGANGGDAVDCSALMQKIYRAAGLELPRTTKEQLATGTPVRASELKKGDLLFYRWQRRNLHVAVYMDDGYILHASPSKGGVVLTRLNPSWRKRLVAARRLL